MMEPQIPPELVGIAAFVNTLDRESGVDAIATPAGLKHWLVEQQLLAKSARATGADVVRAAALREALRDALRAEDVDRLNRELRSWPLVVQLSLDDGGPEVTPLAAAGVDGALGRVV